MEAKIDKYIPFLKKTYRKKDKNLDSQREIETQPWDRAYDATTSMITMKM